MVKQWIIGFSVLILAGVVAAQAGPYLFNTPIEIWNSDTRGFAIVENYLTPKDHFRVDTTPGGHIYTTTIEPIGAPNPSIGTPSNPYSGGIYGQTLSVVAGVNISCSDQCNNVDGKPINSYNWTCSHAFLKSGAYQSCAAVGRERNCICKN